MIYRQQSDSSRDILVTASNGRVFGLARKTGEVRWENELVDSGWNDVFLAMRHDTLMASSTEAFVYRIDYKTGATVWRVETKASGQAQIVIESDCITVAKGGYLECFDLEGHRLWRRAYPNKWSGALAFGYSGNILQAGENSPL